MAKNTATERLKKLDPNFQSKTSKSSLKWIDAFDKRVALRGLGWLPENRRKKNFRRLPDRAAKPLSEGVQSLSHCPSSVFLSFFTDSPDISVRMTVGDLGQMDHMPATGMSGAELYFRDGPHWYTAAVAKASLTELEFTRSLLEGAPRERREYRLYLPLYKKLDQLAIGIAPGSLIEPAPADTKPVFFYGTSITQGGCANTAGSDFVSNLGRRLDTEVINFGFSGNGKGEPEIARLISELDLEILVLDYVANVDAALLRRTLPEFVAIFRAKHPTTPIVLISNVPYDQTLWNARTRADLEGKRDVMMAFYLAAKEAGDTNLHFIDGHGLLPIGASGMYVDGVHPTSGGFSVIAERLAPQIARILLWARRKS
jgi:lysophospholipase L1-like esterase